MPDLYFNPYPGAATEVLDGARALVVTAKAVEELRSNIQIGGIQAEGEGINRFCMVRDSSLGCTLNLSDLLPSLSGTDRTIAQRFLTLFSMGKVLDATGEASLEGS